MKSPFLAEQIYTQNGRRIEFGADMRVYNLGSGNQVIPHVIGVDLVAESKADIICDLNRFPWPIETDSADAIISFHSFEHFDDLPKVMEEVYRIGKDGAHVLIEVPYFRSVGAFQDPTHRHFFTTRTMQYFSRNESLGSYHYSNSNFFVKDFWLGWPASSRNPFTRFFKNFIRIYPDFYDAYLSLLFPVDIIVYELEVNKESAEMSQKARMDVPRAGVPDTHILSK